jgi:DNA-binding NarL/FixJ family response regulator
MDPVMIAVCSPDPLALPAVVHLLGDEPGLLVVPAQRLREAAVAFVVADELDATALDLLTRAARSSSARIVLLVDQLDEAHVAALVRCRVVSVLGRHAATATSLAAAIDNALRFAPPPGELAAQLLGQLERVAPGRLHPRAGRISAFEPRERELLRLLAEGYDTAEIATALSYSERTVKNIVRNLLTRLHLRNRAHAVAFALRTGALTAHPTPTPAGSPR